MDEHEEGAQAINARLPAPVEMPRESLPRDAEVRLDMIARLGKLSCRSDADGRRAVPHVQWCERILRRYPHHQVRLGGGEPPAGDIKVLDHETGSTVRVGPNFPGVTALG